MRRWSAFAAILIVGAACATIGAARPGAAHPAATTYEGVGVSPG